MMYDGIAPQTHQASEQEFWAWINGLPRDASIGRCCHNTCNILGMYLQERSGVSHYVSQDNYMAFKQQQDTRRILRGEARTLPGWAHPILHLFSELGKPGEQVTKQTFVAYWKFHHPFAYLQREEQAS